ncbi:MAG TPA: DUF6234 family protein [Actinospica sp.]|nr:DUF6234 family protein [Actinospica sp.]
MADEVQDDIQDAVPEQLPARLPIPFKYHEEPDRPSSGSAIAMALVVDLSLLLMGGYFTFAISFQGFGDHGPDLASKQISQTELVCGVAVVILAIAAAYAWWVRSMGTVLFQCVLVLVVLVVTASSVNGYSRSLPQVGTPSVQPTSTSTFVPCFSGSNGPGCN